jgi:hypothetical protein
MSQISVINYSKNYSELKILLITPYKFDILDIFEQLDPKNIAIIIPIENENFYKKFKDQIFEIITVEKYSILNNITTNIINLYKKNNFKFDKIICTHDTDFELIQEALVYFNIGSMKKEDAELFNNKGKMLKKISENNFSTVKFSMIFYEAHLYEFISKYIKQKQRQNDVFSNNLILEGIGSGKNGSKKNYKEIIHTQKELEKFITNHSAALNYALSPQIIATIEIQNKNKYNIQGLIIDNENIHMILYLNDELIDEHNNNIVNNIVSFRIVSAIKDYTKEIINILPKLSIGSWFNLEVFEPINNLISTSIEQKNNFIFIFSDFKIFNYLPDVSNDYLKLSLNLQIK